jgi:hypothetical protein
MDIMNVRTWIFFYLICFVAVLWAVFLLVQGTMLWIALTIAIIVIGFNFILIWTELKAHKKKEKMMKAISSEIINQKTDMQKVK